MTTTVAAARTSRVTTERERATAAAAAANSPEIASAKAASPSSRLPLYRINQMPPSHPQPQETVHVEANNHHTTTNKNRNRLRRNSNRRCVCQLSLRFAAVAVAVVAAAASGFEAAFAFNTFNTNLEKIRSEQQRLPLLPPSHGRRLPLSFTRSVAANDDDNSNDKEGLFISPTEISANDKISATTTEASASATAQFEFGQSVSVSRVDVDRTNSPSLETPHPADTVTTLTTGSTSAATATATATSSTSSSQSSSVPSSSSSSSVSSSSYSSSLQEQLKIAADIQRRNVITAVASIAAALLNYAWQFLHPVEPIQLLVQMQQESAPLSVIGRNGKPTIVDVWAPWCENCKLAAPTLRQVELEYKDQVNFILVNGDDMASTSSSWAVIQALGVDAIPHIALIDADGTVETALIGPIPKHVLRADIDTLLQNAAASVTAASTSTSSMSNSAAVAATSADAPLVVKQPLPYQMLDVFANNPEKRKVSFDDL